MKFVRYFLVNYFLFCVCFFSLFSSGYVDSQDGLQYLAIARRIYFDHSFELPPGTFEQGTNIPMSPQPGKDDKQFSPTGLGYSLSLLPAVFVEDVLLRVAGVEPLTNFPLENDWPVLLFASMTNAIWGALLAVVLYKYLRALGVEHRWSVWSSFIGILSSNLWIYTKHVFPHMMFTALLTLSFYLLRQALVTQKKKLMIAAGAAFGGVIVSYNPTFLFAVPAIGLYYLLLQIVSLKKKVSISFFKTMVRDLMLGLAGGSAGIISYLLFNMYRFGGSGTSGYSSTGNLALPRGVPAYVYLQGMWGLLLSPGKSIFLFSPLLLLLIIFWHKLSKKQLPEIGAFIGLCIPYLYFIATLMGGVDFLVWHGDSSWGPRYLLPILPLAVVLVGYIVSRLSNLHRIAIVLPIVVVGVIVQLIGIMLPYQIRFMGLQSEIYFGQNYMHVNEYGNFIPRFSPVFSQGKMVVKRLLKSSEITDRGEYKVRLFDGFERPFNVGYMFWREPLQKALISFDSPAHNPVKDIYFQFRNHPTVTTSSYSAQVRFTLNDHHFSDELTVPVDKEQGITLSIPVEQLKPTNNILMLDKVFVGTTAAALKDDQLLFMQIMRVNDQSQRIDLYDYPYVSPISQHVFGAEYFYLGKIDRNPWIVWHLHSGVYENSFDFWWLRPLYYWDLPKGFFTGLFVLILAGATMFGWLILAHRPTKSVA